MSKLLSSLAVGSKVKFGKFQVNTETPQDIIWTIVAQIHTDYPTNAITLHASEILDLRCFDAKEPNNSNTNIQSYGNNYYTVSNLDQWLNKSDDSGEWYSAAHTEDQAPDTSAGTGNNGTQYTSRPGFLNSFSSNERNAILTTTIRVGKLVDSVYTYEDIQRKVFLPSTTEVGLANEMSVAEGSAWGYYTGNSVRISYLTQQCFDNTLSSSKSASKTKAWRWWLRTCYGVDSYNVRSVNSAGALEYAGACSGYIGVRPALNLSSSLEVSDSTDSDGCYTFVWPYIPEYTAKRLYEPTDLQETKTVTANGTVTPDGLFAAMKKVVVNVPSSGEGNTLVASTDDGMTALITAENAGKVIKYTGESSDTYATDEFYWIKTVESSGGVTSEPCSLCNGSGIVNEPCGVCNGSGSTETTCGMCNGSGSTETTCGMCSGSGFTETTCGTCGGSGQVEISTES